MPSQTILNQRTLYPLVAQSLESFLTDCHIRRLSPRTIEFYKAKLKLFALYCEAQAISTIDQLDTTALRRFFLWLEERGNNPGGRHAFYRTLRAWLRWMEDEYEGFISPLRRLKPPKVEVQPIEGVGLADVKALLATCDKTFSGRRDKALLLVLLDSGLRIGECLQLDWNDVDLVGGSVLVRHTKNKKPRTVFLGRAARQALRAYAKLRKDDHPAVWLTVHGERMTYTAVREVLRRRSRQAGLKQIPSPHDFRRTCALQMLRNGADVVSVSRLLGHSSLEVTKRYLAQTEEDLQQTHNRHSPGDRLE